MSAGKNASTARRRARQNAAAAGLPVPEWAAIRPALSPEEMSAKTKANHRRRHARRAREVQQPALDYGLAAQIADSMDLPDGAYFAVLGDLMGGADDDDGGYMRGIEASIGDEW